MVMVDPEIGYGIHQNGHCFVTLFLVFGVCFWKVSLCKEQSTHNCRVDTGDPTAPLKQNLCDRLTVSRVSRAPCRVLSCLVVCWVVVCSRGGTSVK